MKRTMLILITLFASLTLVAACSKSEDESGSLEKTTERAVGAVSKAASEVKHATGNAMDKAGEMAADARDAAGEAMSDMGEAASSGMDKAGEMAADAEDAADAAGEAMSDMGDAAGETADDAMVAVGVVQASGDAAKGKELSVDCADCHSENGMGDDGTPRLAGLDEAYFVEQMQAYKAGTRKDEDDIMLMYAENLSDQDMSDLAAYYATLPAQ